jgi:hypothetical protein
MTIKKIRSIGGINTINFTKNSLKPKLKLGGRIGFPGMGGEMNNSFSYKKFKLNKVSGSFKQKKIETP